MCIFCGRQAFDPFLIDLDAYEGELLRQKEHSITLRPPPLMPERRGREWTLAERQLMRANLAEAQAMYERVGGG